MSFRLDHPFLQFPEGPASSVEYSSRRDALIGRRVLEATIIDRDILRDAGLWGEIEPFLHRTWTHEDASFTCRGWDRLMANEEEQLGGAQRECSPREFARHTGIYTKADLQHRYFAQFFGACIQGQPERAANMEVWAPLSNIFYEAGTSRESHLRDPLHHLMHRIVSTTIMHREGGEKVSGDDMTYLRVLLDPSRFLHLPFALAVALSTRATGASSSSPLARRHYITRLARSYRILTAQTVATLTALPPSRTSARALQNMGLIEQQRPGQYIRVATEAPRDPQPAYAQPGRRRRRQAAPAEPAPQPQPQ
ncbi:hypothetical protein L1887_42003 [Cichorium endivia]|nr:hypothetical protein L1887_42003 [Cichorium endivia]